jgi:hypothetical protein
MLRRIERDTAILCALLALAALAIWPSRWRVAGGVVGGGALIGFAYWAIKGFVEQVSAPGAGGDGVAGGRRHLVKFFTRHGILALAAYVMMARLRLDAFGMLAGASALVLAMALEAARNSRSGRATSGR